MKLCILALLFVTGSTAAALDVAVLQEDGAFSEESYLMARQSGNWSRLDEFSVCFRALTFRLRGPKNYLVSYAVDQKLDNALAISEQRHAVPALVVASYKRNSNTLCSSKLDRDETRERQGL